MTKSLEAAYLIFFAPRRLAGKLFFRPAAEAQNLCRLFYCAGAFL
jgi:hypothetical protein